MKLLLQPIDEEYDTTAALYSRARKHGTVEALLPGTMAEFAIS